MTNKRDPYQDITDRIVAAIEAGAPPWVRPWRSCAGASDYRNALTGRPYHGINTFLLAMEPYADPRWLTFRQAKQLGGSVRRGQSATRIAFWKFLKVRDRNRDGDGEPERLKTIPFLRIYSVFNVAQCEGVKLKDNTAETLTEPERDAALEAFARDSGIPIAEGGDKAYYSTTLDSITLPPLATFTDAGAYYAAKLHEMMHATGHKARTARDLTGRFGTASYAMEELVAELGSAFLCQRYAVDGTLQHPAYVASWLRVLKADKRAIFTAASAARKGCEWLYDKTGEPTASLKET